MDIEIENYMKTLNLEEVCRTCLSECDEMTSLFTELEPTDEDDDISFVYQILMNVTSMQVYVDDGMPTLICKNCIENANNAFKFKVLCERSEALLQTFLNRARIKDEIDVQKDEECTADLVDPISLESVDETVENIVYLNQSDTETEQTTLETNEVLDQIVAKEEIIESTQPHNQTEEILGLDSSIADKIKCKQRIQQNKTRKKIKPNPNITPESSELITDIKTEIIKPDESSTESSLQEFVIKPDVQVNYCDDKTPKNKIIISKNQTELSDAAFVASSEENIRLRERITLKKMYSSLNTNGQTRSKPRKKRTYFHPYKLNEQGEKVFTCKFCQKEYKHSTSLTVHIRSHTMERPYLCTLCGKGFKQFTGLSYHMRSHTGEQPFQCELCDKRYRQSASLTAHMRIHTGQRPFLCSVCGKGFRQAPDLGYHMRTHTKEKPYMCSVCGKRMSMQCHLVQHMRTHTGEKPFPCPVCGKAFASTTRLKRHEIIHTGLKPFVCEICNKAFNRASTLRVHAMTHSDERPHVCQICGKGFIQAHCLRAHLKTHF